MNTQKVKIIIDRHNPDGQMLKGVSLDASRETLAKSILGGLFLVGAQPKDQIVVKFEMPL